MFPAKWEQDHRSPHPKQKHFFKVFTFSKISEVSNINVFITCQFLNIATSITCYLISEYDCNVNNSLLQMISGSYECSVNPIIKFFMTFNENHGQRKRYKRHIANVSITPVIIISALQIEVQWSWCRFLLVIQEKSAVKMKNVLWMYRKKAIK